jgi:hypothetical protein
MVDNWQCPGLADPARVIACCGARALTLGVYVYFRGLQVEPAPVPLAVQEPPARIFR